MFNLAEAKYGYKSESTAFAFLETAKIYSLKEEFHKAVENQMIAVNILIDINFDKPEYVAELYNNLANYQEKTDDKEGVVSSLIKVKQNLKTRC